MCTLAGHLVELWSRVQKTIIVDCHPEQGVRVFVVTWARVQIFSSVTGLNTNLDKLGILLKGGWEPVRKVDLFAHTSRLLRNTNIPVRIGGPQRHKRCMGQRYAKLQVEPFLCNLSPCHLKREWNCFKHGSSFASLSEMCHFSSAKCHFSNKDYLSHCLKNELPRHYPDMLSHPRLQGGTCLAPPKIFLLWPFSTLFSRYVSENRSHPLMCDHTIAALYR